jgi:hypothetical protein
VNGRVLVRQGVPQFDKLHDALAAHRRISREWQGRDGILPGIVKPGGFVLEADAVLQMCVTPQGRDTAL